MPVAHPHPERLSRRVAGAVALALTLPAALPLCAQQLEWENAMAEGSTSGDSWFTEVIAAAGDGSTTMDGALACGHFTGDFNMGIHSLTNPSGQDGIVALFQQDNVLPFAWDTSPLGFAHAASVAGNVEVTDITAGPGGTFFITGTFSEDVTFSGSGTTLNAVGSTVGFVAWGDISTVSFSNAFMTTGMQPIAIAVDPNGDIYVTGSGQLARKYPAGGGLADWNAPVPTGTDAFIDIATSPDPFDPNVYVLIQNGTINSREVNIIQLDRTTGTENWTSRVGGNATSDDTAGALDVGYDHDVRVVFATQNTAISYESPTVNFTLPGIPPIAANHGVLLRINPAGELVWHTPLGIAQNAASSLIPTSVSVGPTGNTYTAARFDGNFIIETVPHNANVDTAILGVDSTGLLFDFHRSSGPGLDDPQGVAVDGRRLAVCVGNSTDGNSMFDNAMINAPAADIRAFFAALGPVPMQDLLIFTPDDGMAGAPTVPQLVNEIHNVDGQLYTVVNSPNGPLAVSAWLTPDQIAEITLDGDVLVEPDSPLGTAGTSSDSGYALNHLNDATNPPAGSYSYSYMDLANNVNVYLVDTAVDNTSGWFDSNSNLTLESTTLVRGSGDPTVSSVFQHGTEMLSLVAGPDTGSALGVPLTVKNFDFYPNGEPSTASLLADAIYQAVDYHLDNNECEPGLILISSSGVGSSSTISTAVACAITEGIPVVVSAGNGNADASTYTPAADGTTSGVICAAGSKQDRTKEAGSNHTTIDLSAPGDSVRVINYASPGSGYGSFTGTSASAALTAGVAAAHLSRNPWFSPAALETSVSGDTYLDGGSGLSILQLTSSQPSYTQTYDTWTTYYSLSDVTHLGDDDDDGWCNLAEYFHGLKPTEFDAKGTQAWITYSNSTGNYTYTFNIATALLDTTSLGTMLDGGTYAVHDSTTATSFSAAPGSLSVGSSTGLQTTLSLENTVVDPKCFFQIELSPASPSP